MRVAPNKPVQWLQFSSKMMKHLERYVGPQYGLELPSETLEEWDMSAIKMKLKSYVDRIGRSARGDQDAARDMLKIAHFACFGYALLTKGSAQASLDDE